MVEASFTDISTDFTCLSLVTEFTKFLLHRKQQIPFSYDRLCLAVRKKQHADKEHKKRLKLDPSENLFKVAEKCVNTIEEIFQRTSTEFANEKVSVSEVVLLLGGSILTPKQVYRLHLPNFELGHLPKHHSGQLIMTEVLKVIVESDELDKMFEQPVPPTSLFLLLKVRGEPHCTQWLIPKPRYTIPTMGQHVDMRFKFATPESVACSCKGFNFFSDISVDNISIPSYDLDTGAISSEMAGQSQIWYQVPLVVKGFTDNFIKNVSVAKDWLTCS